MTVCDIDRNKKNIPKDPLYCERQTAISLNELSNVNLTLPIRAVICVRICFS